MKRLSRFAEEKADVLPLSVMLIVESDESLKDQKAERLLFSDEFGMQQEKRFGKQVKIFWFLMTCSGRADPPIAEGRFRTFATEPMLPSPRMEITS
jgi:hypothetical protein